MRAAALMLAGLLLAGPAAAQSLLGQSRPGGGAPASPGSPGLTGPAPLAPVQVVPLSPDPAPAAPPVVAPPVVAPPVVAPPVGPPLVVTPGAALPAQPMPAPVPGSPPGPEAGSAAPSVWVAQSGAELRGVDKVTARTAVLSARPGEALRFGPLSVVLRHCVVRAADRAADAAAYLEISEGARMVFRGWMVLSQPQLGLVEHPTHDIRLFGCRP